MTIDLAPGQGAEPCGCQVTWAHQWADGSWDVGYLRCVEHGLAVRREDS